MKSIDQLRREAKALRKAVAAGDTAALSRAALEAGDRADGLKHADYLHIIARENGFASWPRLAFAAGTVGLDRLEKQERLRHAVAHGQIWRIERLLGETPDLANGDFGLACALYDRATVERVLAEDPARATAAVGAWPPVIHLAMSRFIHARPDLEAEMLAIAGLLVAHGADVNHAVPAMQGGDERLSALYFALGHAGNMPLALWLLERGADPDDGESLYHSTELGHHEGLKMLLAHGADPRGTNALLRAMDFHDEVAVGLLLHAGARVDEFEGRVAIPALHQAARRLSRRAMIRLLMDSGADPAAVWEGASAYGYARVFGNPELARAIEARGEAPLLTDEEELLAGAAEGREAAPGRRIDSARLAPAYRDLVGQIVPLAGRLNHLRRLAALGVETNRPDAQGLTPIQHAGWQGLPEVVAWLLTRKPDLSRVNAYGGTLLTTIMHGSENHPERESRDHVGCLRLALEQGVALPRRALALADNAEVAAFLADWAEAHPGQVTEGLNG